jgi:ArsR family transcriptional regulator
MRAQEVFKALSDPTRRAILSLLKDGSLTAGEIAAHFEITKGSLSHHFNVLKSADLVRAERRGQSIVYSLNTTMFQDVAALMLDLFATGTGSQGQEPRLLNVPVRRRGKLTG